MVAHRYHQGQSRSERLDHVEITLPDPPPSSRVLSLDQRRVHMERDESSILKETELSPTLSSICERRHYRGLVFYATRQDKITIETLPKDRRS
jgi:hypothetical protein